MKAIEWRSSDGKMWHIYWGMKSICSRAYAHSSYRIEESPPADSRCSWCKKVAPQIINRLQDLSQGDQ